MAVIASVAATVAVTVAACGGSAKRGTPTPAKAQAAAPQRPQAVVADCSTHSEAGFPGAFSDTANVVVGPLAMVGAAYTDPGTVRRFGGNKFPVLVKEGHRVTVALTERTRRIASLYYGPPHGGILTELSVRDGHRAVTFIACGHGERSGSAVDGQPVTFWSGFVLVSTPACVPLEIWVDDETTPRRTTLRMGVSRCP